MVTSGRIKPELRTLISENDLCQSWLAEHKSSGEQCFVKTLNAGSEIDNSAALRTFSRSYECQKHLASGRIITATQKYTDAGKPCIEYPYLDPQLWQPLTPERFWQNPKGTLTQICVLVDYLHLKELVHCDLKLSNFLVRRSGNDPHPVLVDLDFLTSVGSSPNAKIFGTPDHIAPEILSNDIVVAQTDNFSLGIALRQCVEYYDQNRDTVSPIHEAFARNLANLVDNLTAEYSMNRPFALSDALHKAAAIDGERLDSFHRRLVSMLLLDSFKSVRGSKVAKFEALSKAVWEDNRILGIGEEISRELFSVFEKNRLRAVGIIKRMVDESTIQRFGEYWHIKLSDCPLKGIFDEIDKVLESDKVMTTAGANDLINRADRLQEEGKPTKAFLTYKAALKQLESVGEVGHVLKTKIIKELADLSRDMNRFEDAAGYYRILLSLTDQRSRDGLEVILSLAGTVGEMGHAEEASELVELGLTLARECDNQDYELRFMRRHAWRCAMRGEYDPADQLLDSILNRCRGQNVGDLELQVHYTRAVGYWRRGLMTKVEECCLKGLESGRKYPSSPYLVRTLGLLANACQDLAEYDRSIAYGMQAAEHLDPLRGSSSTPYVAMILANSYSRAANRGKAEYWLMKSLGVGLTSDLKRRMVSYYHLSSYTMMNAGNYDEAMQRIQRARELIDDSIGPRVAVKVFHVMAEIALYQGERERCEESLRLGYRVNQGTGDEASNVDLDLLSALNNTYNAEDPRAALKIAPSVEKLLHLHSRYSAVWGIFHLLINGDYSQREKALGFAKPLRKLLTNSPAPLFRAVAVITDSADSDRQNLHPDIAGLKTAYRILNDGGDTFLALIVCRRIAELYEANSNLKLARKFYEQAQKLAVGTRNQRMIKSLEVTISALNGKTADSSRMIESVLAVSKILKNIDDYDRSVEAVVKFAVNQTGAERGVLLLKSEHSNDLRVGAFVNCDEDSLNDIKDFSSSIPIEVARSIDPLIIDNALADKRTKGYKSIVLHNILSVICVPISMDNRVLGVLYLDHHTIPALFDKNDISYVSSIANVMAVMLSTIQSYRDMTVINKQLVEDVYKSGGMQTFVTQDESVRRLFDKLPEIARTSAPVLIIGESGTGKEILCEMIHNLSLRSSKPLVKLNCAAIAASLIESELFGVSSHVATDVKEREGKFSAADGGTLLLDEIGDMPMEVQAKVLRAVEYQEFEKVGSNKTLRTDIRFVYATNKNLSELVKSGKFRQDLFYRINTITIEVPPLRERRGDILPLLEHFVGLFSAGSISPRFTSEALALLHAYHWPGNVRELRNLVERCCILYAGEKVDVSSLPPNILDSAGQSDLGKETGESIERARIRKALFENNFNQSKTSAELGIPLSTLRRKIKKYKITKEI